MSAFVAPKVLKILCGWKHSKGEPLFTKKIDVYKPISQYTWYTKILMAFFGYFKHEQFFLKFTWQHYGTQCSLWVLINFDPTIKWKILDKINVHRVYITYNVFTTLRLHVCGS